MKKSVLLIFFILLALIFPVYAQENDTPSSTIIPDFVIYKDTKNDLPNIQTRTYETLPKCKYPQKDQPALTPMPQRNEIRTLRKSNSTEINYTFGRFSEENTNRYDYTVNYLVIRPERNIFRIQYDSFNNPVDFKRLWVNTGSLELAKSPGFEASFRPGMIFDNREKLYYGGFFDINFPKLGLSSHYRCFAGNIYDKHLAFTTLKITPNFYIQNYLYFESNTWSADSNIGPGFTFDFAINKIKFNVNVWAGTSLCRSNANSIDLSFSSRF